MKVRYLVPEGMLKAAGAETRGIDPDGYMLAFALEAALRWLAHNPIVPNDEQAEEIRKMYSSTGDLTPIWKFAPVEWQRRMFLAPEKVFGDGFNGPHVLTDSHGWTARCCGDPRGCVWCANEENLRCGLRVK